MKIETSKIYSHLLISSYKDGLINNYKIKALNKIISKGILKKFNSRSLYIPGIHYIKHFAKLFTNIVVVFAVRFCWWS